MHFLFLPKCPRKRTPPSSQQGSVWHSCPLLGLFYVSLIFLIKFPLYKQNFPFYQGPQEGSVSSCSSKAGPLWKQAPISRALISISFAVPSKVAHFQIPLRGLPQKRHSEFTAPFIHLTTSLVNYPLTMFPNRTQMERDAHLQKLTLHNLQDPQLQRSSPGSLTELPQREMLHFHSPPFTISQRFQ